MMKARTTNQRGATLLISLVMLVVLTLFAVTMFNLSSVNLRIAGNFQNQKYMEAAAQQALEEALSNPSWLGIGATNHDIVVNGFTVSIAVPKCYYTGPAEGYSLKVGTLVPDDNDWELKASVNDTYSNARATHWQGVRMRALAGNCP